MATKRPPKHGHRDLLALIDQQLNQAGAKLPFGPLSKAERVTLGGSLFQGDADVVLTLAEALTSYPHIYNEVDEDGPSLHAEQRAALMWRRIAVRLRLFTDMAEGTYVKLQSDLNKRAIATLGQVRANNESPAANDTPQRRAGVNLREMCLALAFNILYCRARRSHKRRRPEQPQSQQSSKQRNAKNRIKQRDQARLRELLRNSFVGHIESKIGASPAVETDPFWRPPSDGPWGLPHRRNGRRSRSKKIGR